MSRRDNPAWIMCNQITFECEKRRSDIIRKAAHTCADTNKIIPDALYFELLSEGESPGEPCRCPRCSVIETRSRGRLRR
jgi:hypothetical protein